MLLLPFPWTLTFSLLATSCLPHSPPFSVHWPWGFPLSLFFYWPCSGFPIHLVHMVRNFRDVLVQILTPIFYFLINLPTLPIFFSLGSTHHLHLPLWFCSHIVQGCRKNVIIKTLVSITNSSYLTLTGPCRIPNCYFLPYPRPPHTPFLSPIIPWLLSLSLSPCLAQVDNKPKEWKQI